LIAALSAIVGPAHVLTRESGADLVAWERDWRGRQQGHALAVVRPASTAEVAAVVRTCAAAGVPIVPQGGNTGLVVGGVPDGSGREVVLSLQRLNRIRAIDRANLTLTAEAGCILQAVQEAAQGAGLLFPLSLAAEGSCTIGGNLATNAGGTQVLRYGNTRDLCLGLEVVTAQGEVWEGLSGLRKDNTGYDLRHLFIGSEGTLGIITAACLRLYPPPVAQLTAWAALPSLDAAVSFLELAQQQLAAGLTGFELMGQFALRLVDKHYAHLRVPLWRDAPYCVLLEHSHFDSDAHARSPLEGLLEAALAQSLVSDAIVAENLAQARALWHIRESIPLAQTQEGLNIKHDVSVAVSRIPSFVADATATLAAALPGIRVVNFGHLGDGNLHFNVQAPEGTDPAVFLREQEARVNTLVYDAVARAGGSISAEHGIGALKVHTLPHYKSPVALDLMARIKHALDPAGLLNPGRVVPHQKKP
jgi:FAD/FMN-containing dehydrogenase